MQPVIGDDSFDAAGADGVALLAEFLSYDIHRAVRVQEAISNDQTNDLFSSAVIGFRSWSFGQQAHSTMFLETMEELIIALAAVAEEFSGLGNIGVFALTLDEHGQTTANNIIVGDLEGAIGAREVELLFREQDVHSGKKEAL